MFWLNSCEAAKEWKWKQVKSPSHAGMRAGIRREFTEQNPEMEDVDELFPIPHFSLLTSCVIRQSIPI